MQNRNLFHFLILLTVITACGGGGGGGGSTSGGDGGGYGQNSAPTINNTQSSYSVLENQTAAFSVEASDPDGDTLTYSITSGGDGDLFQISSSGVVTFVTAPDFEAPADANADNNYELTARVSDGSLFDSMAFTVVVTNDSSDDPTASGFSGTLVHSGYVQSGTVCVPVQDSDGDLTCSGATYSATTDSLGAFEIEISDEDAANTTLLAELEDGFDVVTNDNNQILNVLALGEPVTNQNLVISPLSSLLANDSRFTYTSLKDKLGIDQNFMIRFDDPFGNLGDPAANQAAVVNTQIVIMQEMLLKMLSEGYITSTAPLADLIYARDANSETSLGDTTFVRDVALNLELTEGSLDNTTLENLSAVTSSYLQKVYASATTDAHAYFASTARTALATLVAEIIEGTASTDEMDQIIFNTLDWLNDNVSGWSGGSFEDVEADLKVTTYEVGNSGSSYYTVDGVNADSTALIIYARVGDTITFEPTTSSVFSQHPFEISTTANDTGGSNNIGANEGWDQGSHTLTVNSNTPMTLYPHCGVHAGMYTNGRIEIVTTYDNVSFDVTGETSGLEVKGTVAVGPYKGASGYTHKVYLRAADAGSDYHEHQFDEFPGITFYMSADQGYHGASAPSGETTFKPKSHY